MIETVESMVEASRRFELANEEFNIAVRRVAGEQASEVPDPDFNKTFEDYVELLKDREIKPDLSSTPEGDELLEARRELKNLNAQIQESQNNVVQLSRGLRDEYSAQAIEDLQQITDELEAQKKSRDDLIETIRDLLLTMDPAVAFKVLEDSFSQVKQAWQDLNSLNDDLETESAASQQAEEAHVEESNLELDQLIKNDPLDADS